MSPFFLSYYLRNDFQTKGGLFINNSTESAKKPRQTKYKYNTVAIKTAADPLVVAHAIGMDIQDSNNYGKSKASVLCPGHNDRRHGSCFITQAGCHCYVCNKSFDVFEMVMLHCGAGFHEAAGIVADLCGGRERFLVEYAEYAGDGGDDFTGGIRMISHSDMNLIGIFNTPVYISRKVVSAWNEPEREHGMWHNWYPGELDEEDSDYVVIEECVTRDPLRDLLREEPEEYMRLIREKALEALIRERGWQEFARRISRSYARTLTKNIRKIEEILIEHGGSLRDPPKAFGEENEKKDERMDFNR